jgi:hypothetical protein
MMKLKRIRRAGHVARTGGEIREVHVKKNLMEDTTTETYA